MIHVHKSGDALVLARTKNFYQAAKWLLVNATAFGGGVFEIWRYEQRGRRVDTELEAVFDTEMIFDLPSDLL